MPPAREGSAARLRSSAAMKIAATSASFAPRLDSGNLTHLEWLDVCANELEVDGIVASLSHFPRTDSDYLAQFKKTCLDLGLTIAAVDATATAWPDLAGPLDLARTIGAPLITVIAPPASGDPAAWNAFATDAKAALRIAKDRNVGIALAAAPHTLCPSAAELVQIAKDTDSSWLRYAVEPAALGPAATDLLARAAIALHTITNAETFAGQTDTEAPRLIGSLARFRAFIALQPQTPTPDAAYHHAVARFTTARTHALASPAENS